MSFTPISNFITHIPDYISSGVDQVKRVGTIPVNWVSQKLSDLRNEEPFNKLYTHYIEQLDIKDGVIFARCAIVASVVMFTAIAIFGKPFIAMSAITAMGILCLSGVISKKRLEKKVEIEVGVIFLKLRDIVKQADLEHPQFTKITKKRGLIRDIKEKRIFGHMQDEIKSLDGQIKIYYAQSQNEQRFPEIKEAFEKYLSDTCDKLIGKKINYS